MAAKIIVGANELANSRAGQLADPSSALFKEVDILFSDIHGQHRADHAAGRLTAPAFLQSVHLPEKDEDVLRRAFPELRFVKPKVATGRGGYLEAARRAMFLALWQKNRAQTGDRLFLIGATSRMFAPYGLRNAHIYSPVTQDWQTKRNVCDITEMRGIFENREVFSEIATETPGATPPTAEYIEGHYKREVLPICGDPKCTHALDLGCEYMVADLTVHGLTLQQVATHMIANGIEVGQAFFFHSPQFLFSDRGEIGCSKIFFEHEPHNKRIVFRYPQGQYAVPSIDYDTLSTLYSSHSFCVTVKKSKGASDVLCKEYFTVEWTDRRDIFGVVRLTHVGNVKPPAVKHRIQLFDEDMYLLKYTQTQPDGTKERVTQLLPATYHDMLYTYFMGLTQKAFSTQEVFRKIVSWAKRRIVRVNTVKRFESPLEANKVGPVAAAYYVFCYNRRFAIPQIAAEIKAESKHIGDRESFRSRCANAFSKLVGPGSSYMWSRFSAGVDILEGLSVDSGSELPEFVRLSRFVEFTGSPCTLRPEHVVQGMSFSDIFSNVVHNSKRAPPVMVGGNIFSTLRDELRSGVVRMIKRVESDFAMDRQDILTQLEDDGVDLRDTCEAILDPSLDYEDFRPEPQPESFISSGEAEVAGDPVVEIANAFRRALPKLSETDTRFDHGDLIVFPQEMNIRAPEISFQVDNDTKIRVEGFESTMGVGHGHRNAVHNVTYLSTCIDRIYGGTDVTLPSDYVQDAQSMFWRVISRHGRPNARDRIQEWKTKPVTNPDLLEIADTARRYGLDKTRSLIQSLLTGEPGKDWTSIDPSQMNFAVKPDGKPQPNESVCIARQKAQGIRYPAQIVNFVMGGMQKMVDRRLESVFNPNILIDIRRDVEQVEDHLASCINGFNGDVKYYALDFETYDRSHGLFAGALNQTIKRELGLHETLVEIFGEAGEVLFNASLDRSFRCVNALQMPSGRFDTLSFNGGFNLFTTLDKLPFNATTLVAMAAKGDDNIVVGDASIQVDEPLVREVIMAETNLVPKFEKTKTRTFCSALMHIDPEGRVRFLQDLLRKTVKLRVTVPKFSSSEYFDAVFTSLVSTVEKLSAITPEEYGRLLSGLYPTIDEQVGAELLVGYRSIVKKGPTEFRRFYSKEPIYFEV